MVPLVERIARGWNVTPEEDLAVARYVAELAAEILSWSDDPEADPPYSAAATVADRLPSPLVVRVLLRIADEASHRSGEVLTGRGRDGAAFCFEPATRVWTLGERRGAGLVAAVAALTGDPLDKACERVLGIVGEGFARVVLEMTGGGR